MKTNLQKFRHFLGTPIGIVVLFVLIFYALTFTVYWFYGPGPEERRTAQVAAQEAAAGSTSNVAPTSKVDL